MSGKRKTVDAKGLACPEPVVLTKKALEEGGFEEFEVLVDNPAARDNVSRFAGYSGCKLISVTENAGQFVLVLAAPAGAVHSSLAEESCEDTAPAPESATAQMAGATVLIATDRLGRGSDELGALLMKGFIYALAESTTPPKRLIFMNSGVNMPLQSSISLEDLRRLGKRGVEILSCGTCLDYYKVKDSLAVGRVSNMYEIASCLLDGRTVTLS
jgi:selenium metabolism protein YedF